MWSGTFHWHWISLLWKMLSLSLNSPEILAPKAPWCKMFHRSNKHLQWLFSILPWCFSASSGESVSQHEKRSSKRQWLTACINREQILYLKKKIKKYIVYTKPCFQRIQAPSLKYFRTIRQEIVGKLGSPGSPVSCSGFRIARTIDQGIKWSAYTRQWEIPVVVHCLSKSTCSITPENSVEAHVL